MQSINELNLAHVINKYLDLPLLLTFTIISNKKYNTERHVGELNTQTKPPHLLPLRPLMDPPGLREVMTLY